MCSGCDRLWTALQLVWSTVYVSCGAAQLISGIFFMISIPALHLTCNIWTGSWNVIIGIVGGMLSCLSQWSSGRQEAFLYGAVSILTVNSVNVVLSEWGFYFGDFSQLLRKHPSHIFITYACFATRIATSAVLLVAFLDSQFAFCSMHVAPAKNKKKTQGSHEQVSDIEYIIPRPKGVPKSQPTHLDAYSQSWVFDTDAGATTSTANEGPYLNILENGTPIKSNLKKSSISTETQMIDKPVVHIEEASDDSNSNSDRKLCHMRSFSRSTSPNQLSSSNSSSHINLDKSEQHQIYDCLENIYRSRLNSGVRQDEEYQVPQAMLLKSISPHVEKVQYASLMKELQRAIGEKIDVSPESSSSDAEFSKELEAALQLIQDLDTPSEPPRLLNDTESNKTLSPEEEPQLVTFKPANGKPSSIIIHSQSTSGYSSPSQAVTPTWSTTSSLNGNGDPIGFSIKSADSGTVISLYSQRLSPKKSVTVVNIVAEEREKGWKSLLRKHRKPIKLCPELEGAIIKSESLAYLSETELLARHARNKEIQREIEERVVQQLGGSKTESSC